MEGRSLLPQAQVLLSSNTPAPAPQKQWANPSAGLQQRPLHPVPLAAPRSLSALPPPGACSAEIPQRNLEVVMSVMATSRVHKGPLGCTVGEQTQGLVLMSSLSA